MPGTNSHTSNKASCQVPQKAWSRPTTAPAGPNRDGVSVETDGYRRPNNPKRTPTENGHKQTHTICGLHLERYISPLPFPCGPVTQTYPEWRKRGQILGMIHCGATAFQKGGRQTKLKGLLLVRGTRASRCTQVGTPAKLRTESGTQHELKFRCRVRRNGSSPMTTIAGPQYCVARPRAFLTARRLAPEGHGFEGTASE